MGQIAFGRTQKADQTPFDNTSNGFASTDVQAAVEEAASLGSDFHSGWYIVNTGQTVTIAARKQSTCFGLLINDGVINIDGLLILEP